MLFNQPTRDRRTSAIEFAAAMRRFAQQDDTRCGKAVETSTEADGVVERRQRLRCRCHVPGESFVILLMPLAFGHDVRPWSVESWERRNTAGRCFCHRSLAVWLMPHVNMQHQVTDRRGLIYPSVPAARVPAVLANGP